MPEPQFVDVIRMMRQNEVMVVSPSDLMFDTTSQTPPLSADMWYGPGPAIPSSPAYVVPPNLPRGGVRPATVNIDERYRQGSAIQDQINTIANNAQLLAPRNIPAHTGGSTATSNPYSSNVGFVNNASVNHPLGYNTNYIAQPRGRKILDKKANAPRAPTKKTGPLTEQNKATKQPPFEFSKLPLKRTVPRSHKTTPKGGSIASGKGNNQPGELGRAETKALLPQDVNTDLERQGASRLSARPPQAKRTKYNVAPPGKDTILRDETLAIWSSPRDYHRNKGNGTVKLMEKIMAGSPIGSLRREFKIPRDEMLRRMSMLAATSLEVLETLGMSKETFVEILAQYEEGNGKDISEIMEMIHQDQEN